MVKGCEEGGSVGVGEWRAETEGDGGDKLHIRGAARKIAFNRACEDAFSHILLILVPGRSATATIANITSSSDNITSSSSGNITSSSDNV